MNVNKVSFTSYGQRLMITQKIKVAKDQTTLMDQGSGQGQGYSKIDETENGKYETQKCKCETKL